MRRVLTHSRSRIGCTSCTDSTSSTTARSVATRSTSGPGCVIASCNALFFDCCDRNSISRAFSIAYDRRSRSTSRSGSTHPACALLVRVCSSPHSFSSLLLFTLPCPTLPPCVILFVRDSKHRPLCIRHSDGGCHQSLGETQEGQGSEPSPCSASRPSLTMPQRHDQHHNL